MTITALLTGAGSMGRRHAHNLRQLLPGVRLAAVCTGLESKRWAEDQGIQAVHSVEEGLEARPQLGVVCSTSDCHARDLDELLSVVEALYVEKPVMTDGASLDRISARLTGRTIPSVVGCNLRYLGALGRLKQALGEGNAGRLVLASLQVGQSLPDWRPGRDYRTTYSAHRARGGGVLFDLVHELDSACFLFGEIGHAQAAAGHRSRLDIDADDVAAMTLLMRSGLPVQVSLDYVRRQPVREYLVLGDAATLRLDILGRSLCRESLEGRTEYQTIASDWDMESTYVLAMQDLLDAWKTGLATHYSLSDALHVTRWMLKLEVGAWRGETRE
jgi:predicted dehydrogenase